VLILPYASSSTAWYPISCRCPYCRGQFNLQCVWSVSLTNLLYHSGRLHTRTKAKICCSDFVVGFCKSSSHAAGMLL
jgi:hypothetical protein